VEQQLIVRAVEEAQLILEAEDLLEREDWVAEAQVQQVMQCLEHLIRAVEEEAEKGAVVLLVPEVLGL
jgi:hypothetical protein